MTLAIEPAAIASALQDAYRRLEVCRFADALWQRRLEVWSGDPAVREKIAQRLGWLNAIDFVRPHVARLRACADALKRDGITDVVLMGMGGSSLAPEVMRQVLGVAPGFPAFHVLDSVDPEEVDRAMSRAATSVFIFASKSGTTIEPNVMAAEAERRLTAAGIAQPSSRFIAITDSGAALHTRAVSQGFRDVFVNPSDIGGRYSALSFFGLVPAATMGVDLDAFLDRAAHMADACRNGDPRINPGLALGAAIGAAALSGRDKLTLHAPNEVASLGLWVEQLVAESTGKHGKGVVPIAGEDATVPVADDRIAIELTWNGRPPSPPRAYSPGTPVVTLDAGTPLDLGAAFFLWEVATATAGLLLDINPFDEPNVQQAKDATGRLLETYTALRQLRMPEPQASIDGVRLALSSGAEHHLASNPERFLSVIGRHDYVALLAYLPPADEEFASVLNRFRDAIGQSHRCATMLGYGPRYLHSTGQLHKGGPNTGVFVIITAPPRTDCPIPGAPYTFGVLELAQAVGDFQSLDRGGRRALHIQLPERAPAPLAQIAERLIARGSG